MALGHQVVTKLLSSDLNNTGVKHVKGVFTDVRNYKIACRLYYHFSIRGLQYTRAITELHKEFDLSETRIAQIIMLQASTDALKSLKALNPDRKYFQNKFPYYNWF
jgi:hypothetical protein